MPIDFAPASAPVPSKTRPPAPAASEAPEGRAQRFADILARLDGEPGRHPFPRAGDAPPPAGPGPEAQEPEAQEPEAAGEPTGSDGAPAASAEPERAETPAPQPEEAPRLAAPQVSPLMAPDMLRAAEGAAVRVRVSSAAEIPLARAVAPDGTSRGGSGPQTGGGPEPLTPAGAGGSTGEPVAAKAPAGERAAPPAWAERNGQPASEASDESGDRHRKAPPAPPPGPVRGAAEAAGTAAAPASPSTVSQPRQDTAGLPPDAARLNAPHRTAGAAPGLPEISLSGAGTGHGEPVAWAGWADAAGERLLRPAGAAAVEIVRDVARQIAARITPLGRGQFELMLAPAELGRLEISLREVDGLLTLSVTAERPETLEMIRRHVDLLAQELRQIAQRELSLQFGTGGTGGRRGGDAVPTRAPATAAGEAVAPVAALYLTPPTPLDHLDLRL